jgi:hypothetical protein
MLQFDYEPLNIFDDYFILSESLIFYSFECELGLFYKEAFEKIWF